MEDDLEILDLPDYGIPRRVYTRNDYFHTFCPKIFFERFSVTKETVLSFLEDIEVITSIADFGGVHLTTAGRIVYKDARVICSHYQQIIKFPQSDEEKLRTQTGFYEIARFPRVIGAINCTHIKIESPGDGGYYFKIYFMQPIDHPNTNGEQLFKER